MISKILDKPDPPTNLTTDLKTSTSISIKWIAPIFNGNSPITNYTIRYKLENSSTFKENVTMNTSFVLTNLIPAETYVIYVFASNIHFKGCSGQITEVTEEGGMIWQFSFELYTTLQRRYNIDHFEICYYLSNGFLILI